MPKQLFEIRELQIANLLPDELIIKLIGAGIAECACKYRPSESCLVCLTVKQVGEVVILNVRKDFEKQASTERDRIRAFLTNRLLGQMAKLKAMHN